ncbi:hypothetical protein TNCT_59961 [Trichonephila clavata]|uniref:Uncharacterized protein n=1 Tax=Trichonephila clavata TaxID=2740835 RepID=A0A8X6LNL5_TRICU|nr:hypothetical protein TNCT_59961 [Trichonephila clavata]
MVMFPLLLRLLSLNNAENLSVRPFHPRRAVEGRNHVRSSRSPHPLPLFQKAKTRFMEESDLSDDSSEKHVTQKDVTPAAIPGLPGSAEIGDAPSKLDEAKGERFYQYVAIATNIFEFYRVMPQQCYIPQATNTHPQTLN